MAKKPKPAPIQETRNGKKTYRIHFCYQNKQYRRGLIANQNIAYILQSRVNNLIIEYKMGFLGNVPNYKLADYIFSQAFPNQDEKELIENSISTLSELIKEYQQMSRPPIKAESTCKTEAIHIRHLQQFLKFQKLGDPRLENISAGFFQQYKKYRYASQKYKDKNGKIQKTNPARTDTVNKEIGTFQVIFQMAVDHNYLPHNVVRDVKRDKSQAPPHRYKTLAEIEELKESGNYQSEEISEMMRLCYLNAEEIEEFIALAEDTWLHPILITFSKTGMRRGELVRLTWDDVDLDRKVLWATSQKQSRTQREKKRAIPINNALLATLQQQKQITGNSRWVFHGPIPGKQLPTKTLTNNLRKMLKNTRFEGMGFHVFRRSVASLMLARGVGARAIEDILGHESGAMRKIYQHVYPEHLVRAMEALE